MQVSRRQKRRAVSELLSTLIMVAITLVAGAAVFGFVNGQASTSANQYGSSVVNNVDYLREHFVIVSVQFSNSSSAACGHSGGKGYCSQVSVSIYNNGAETLTIKQLIISNVGTTSSGGYAVTPLYFNATSSKTTAYSSNPATTGSKYGCTGSGYGNGASAITVNQVPPTVISIVLPNCLSMTQGMLIGASYQVQVLGLYGNTVISQVTASG